MRWCRQQDQVAVEILAVQKHWHGVCHWCSDGGKNLLLHRCPHTRLSSSPVGSGVTTFHPVHICVIALQSRREFQRTNQMRSRSKMMNKEMALRICTGKPRGTRGCTRTHTQQKPVPAQKGTGLLMGIEKPTPVPTPVKGLPVGNTYKLHSV